MQNKEIEKDKIHLRDLAEDALKYEDNELIGIDAYGVGSITRILQYIDQLEKENKKLKKQDEKDFTLVYMKGYEDCGQKYDSLVNGIKEIQNKLEGNDFVGYADEIQDLLETIEGEKK